MVTDCLAPVITEAGAGTIVTLDNQPVLTDGLEFHPMQIETFLTSPGYHYQLVLYAADTEPRKYRRYTIYVSPDAYVYTTDGWEVVGELFPKYGRKGKMGEHFKPLRVLNFRCLNCSRPYLAKRPIHSTCSKPCLLSIRRARRLTFKPINGASLPYELVEGWAYIYSFIKLDLPGGIQGVRLSNIAPRSGIYVNQLLLSTEKALGK